MLTIGSLFSGIGGLELGLEWAGVGETIWQCESDAFCRGVLAKHWPSVPCYNDVRDLNETTPRADILCGGFPCQDISLAGRGGGIDGERSGLWYEFARVIRLLRPRFVFVENVAALSARGLDRVLADLATSGFNAEWDCIGACCVGAPHRRERLFILACDTDREGESTLSKYDEAPGLPRMAADPSGLPPRQSGGIGGPRGARAAEPTDDGKAGDVANATGGGLRPGKQHLCAGQSDPHGSRQAMAYSSSEGCERFGSTIGGGAPHPEPPISGRWLIEPDVGRVADGIPHRVDRLRGLGNAVVPAQAAKAWEILSARFRSKA